MSKTEYHIGKASKMIIPEGMTVNEVASMILSKTGVTFNEDWYDTPVEQLCNELKHRFFYDSWSDVLYELENTKLDGEDIIFADGDKTSFSYVVSFYNGGYSFTEALEDAFENVRLK